MACAILCISALGALSACSIPVTQATVITGYVFQITATSAYSGELVSDTTNTPVSGSSSQNLTIAPGTGKQYTLKLTKSNNDGTKLTINLIADETINGTATSVVMETSSTTDPNVTASVVLIE